MQPALVAESPFQMECRLHQVVELGSGPGSGLLLLGEVLAFHAREDCWEGGALHPGRLDLVGRHGGSFYCRAAGRPCSNGPSPWAGPSASTPCRSPSSAAPSSPATTWAAWPTVTVLPDLTRPQRRDGDPEDAPALERAIQRALDLDDLDEAWRLAGLRLACG